MPIYLDETTTDETNPHILDFAVFSDIHTYPPTLFKLRPIHVVFKDFERLFFKKRKGIYTVAKLCFLSSLLDKLKPKLCRLLQDKYCMSNKITVQVNKEVFNLVLEEQIIRRVALMHTEFVRAIDTTNDTYVRITVSLGITSISTTLSIEFIFKVRDIPAHPIFDADDLFNADNADVICSDENDTNNNMC
jgi:hypothetical protein